MRSPKGTPLPDHAAPKATSGKTIVTQYELTDELVNNRSFASLLVLISSLVDLQRFSIRPYEWKKNTGYQVQRSKGLPTDAIAGIDRGNENRTVRGWKKFECFAIMGTAPLSRYCYLNIKLLGYFHPTTYDFRYSFPSLSLTSLCNRNLWTTPRRLFLSRTKRAQGFSRMRSIYEINIRSVFHDCLDS